MLIAKKPHLSKIHQPQETVFYETYTNEIHIVLSIFF